MENPMLLHPYFGVFIIFVFTFLAFNTTLRVQRFISRKLADKRNDKLKLSAYECGPLPIKQQNRISHQFYIIAMLFILFDVEVIFMFPWAIDFKALGIFGFMEMLSFLSFLIIGFVYAWKRGALSWHNIK
ncbi:NAD(P)H-quinone oxidoreductase subunit 3 [Helicobacter cappadocius]|uniref:NADH-quinone oxidoreductase subunit A n=1 Tax=Helicobacter cappadocius TaxID=3063998 RepID=A0AA90PU59_9HELI|nr:MULTISPECIES: NAD(P)H-quinone oxidoreductase subunit 3 [unclassified Helicobacter]MDO7253703.1 NAD(P)H-quinone oxidoreductase subunit 3 [Helicobacter sp. faydin-H75]MDP2539609.1 NAD(P)H-quinone oxidoreductase subunit 3 [Helicobacter sp. faydin-H76]